MRCTNGLAFLFFACMTSYVEASCYSCPDHSTSTADIGELECQFLTYASFISLFCRCQVGYTGPIFFSDVDVQCVSLNLTSTSAIGESSSSSVAMNLNSTSRIKELDSVYLDEFLLSHSPGLYACALIGIVGSVLNCIANFVLCLWVRKLNQYTWTCRV